MPEIDAEKGRQARSRIEKVECAGEGQREEGDPADGAKTSSGLPHQLGCMATRGGESKHGNENEKEHPSDPRGCRKDVKPYRHEIERICHLAITPQALREPAAPLGCTPWSGSACTITAHPTTDSSASR